LLSTTEAPCVIVDWLLLARLAPTTITRCDEACPMATQKP